MGRRSHTLRASTANSERARAGERRLREPRVRECRYAVNRGIVGVGQPPLRRGTRRASPTLLRRTRRAREARFATTPTKPRARALSPRKTNRAHGGVRLRPANGTASLDLAYTAAHATRANARDEDERYYFVQPVTDPQTGVARDSLVTRAAICVRLVDVRITCGLHDDAQLAAVFIDPRAK